MRNNNNSVSTLQYHIVWCTKYRHPVLTGAVEVETKTILAQTCAVYGWTLKAIRSGGSGDENDTGTDLCRVWLDAQGYRGHA